MSIRERYELAEELRTRYRGAGRVEKGQLLDSFCLASGYGRKYAVKVLRGPLVHDFHGHLVGMMERSTRRCSGPDRRRRVPGTGLGRLHHLL